MRFCWLMLAVMLLAACAASQHNESIRFGQASSSKFRQGQFDTSSVIAPRANIGFRAEYLVWGETTQCQKPFGLSNPSFETERPDAADVKLRDLLSLKLAEQNVEMSDEASIDLFVEAIITDVPQSLAEKAPTAFCLLDLKSGLYFRPLNQDGEPFRARPGIGREIRTAEARVFVAPDAIWDEINHFLTLDVAELAPTLRGEAPESCGYFQSDPQQTCQRRYEAEIREVRHKLACATDDTERGRWESKLTELEAKMPSISKAQEPPTKPGEIVVDWGIGDCPAENRPALDRQGRGQ
ncbi:hypothetical protein FF098_002445 [Parvularcula flava]|uniref:Lipoprotein n=1 Tax=Aquisalinus luteolus TaxID=1566827 RepID=A0A8J3A1M0_9PROT|nr:hypothetical protein [Aquisalinus luteolus]NHK26767.1 hypothetical protein [Aquisalinus luteolus]GGH93349.1 hypothetical protein GCM10011355_04980 [Aquisalinus luteolus]